MPSEFPEVVTTLFSGTTAGLGRMQFAPQYRHLVPVAEEMPVSRVPVTIHQAWTEVAKATHYKPLIMRGRARVSLAMALSEWMVDGRGARAGH